MLKFTNIREVRPVKPALYLRHHESGIGRIGGFEKDMKQFVEKGLTFFVQYDKLIFVPFLRKS
ncbi:hypothetical protein CS562_30520 [Paenibacillus sp. LK1]|nr:hypothetical protein CS562_30520 [Paenibacillus sp. LK1]